MSILTKAISDVVPFAIMFSPYVIESTSGMHKISVSK